MELRFGFLVKRSIYIRLETCGNLQFGEQVTKFSCEQTQNDQGTLSRHFKSAITCFMAFYYLLRVIQAIFMRSGAPELSLSSKLYNCAQSFINDLIYILLIFLSVKLVHMSFKYIDILNARYQIKVLQVKLILSTVYFPLILGFVFAFFLETMWLYRIFSGTNCSSVYANLIGFNFYNLCWCSQGMSLIVIWIIWFLASEITVRYDSLEESECSE